MVAKKSYLQSSIQALTPFYRITGKINPRRLAAAHFLSNLLARPLTQIKAVPFTNIPVRCSILGHLSRTIYTYTPIQAHRPPLDRRRLAIRYRTKKAPAPLRLERFSE